MISPDDSHSGLTPPVFVSYIPYFDKEAMLRHANQENGQRVHQLLLASKHEASSCLNSIPSLTGISEEVLIQITLQLLEKGWHLRIFSWLDRILKEVPESLSENLIAIASSEYWGNKEHDTFQRKREIFCQRYDDLLTNFISKIEQSGHWDPKLERAYGLYLRHILQKDLYAAKAFRAGFEEDGDSGSVVPYAQILLDKKHFETAKGVLKMGWDTYKDIACLRSLARLHFLTKNSKEAIPMYAYLQALGYPIEESLGSLLRDYQFPRDFDAIEALGASGVDHYLSSTYKQDLFLAIADGMKTFNHQNQDTLEYELRSMRLVAIEFRNYEASLQFVSRIMELYEGGWQKRDMLKNFFEKYPLPRVRDFLSEAFSEDNDEEEEEGIPTDISDSFEDVLSAHLYLTARFAITPERSDLIDLLKNFATEHKLQKLIPLMTDLSLVHERITKFFDQIGEDFAVFYVEIQRAAIENLKGEENYFAVLLAVLEGKFKLNSNIFEDYGNLVAFTSAAIVYGADTEYVESMIESINFDFMSAPAIKQFAKLLQNSGYEIYVLGVMARGDLQDMEILSSLLSVTFSGSYAPEDLVVALTLRPDFDVEFPIDIRTILTDKLESQKLPNGHYNSDIITLLGESFIVYGEIRNGLTLLRQSASLGNLRACIRMAEYYLYQNPKPAKSLKLFEEIYTLTKDPKFLADIARAKQLLLEKEAKKLKKIETYDTSKLLDLIKDLPKNHPDYLCTFLELSVYGNEEVFEKACRVLMFSHWSYLSHLPEDLFEKYEMRMIVEIDGIEGMKRIEWKDMSKHLFYSRLLAFIHQDNIEYTLDYFYDMLSYLEDFQIIATADISSENHRKQTISLRNDIFTQFLQQFSSISKEEIEDQVYTLVEYDENGKEIGFLDQLVDPFAISLMYEVGYFEQIFVIEKKLPKLYEIVAEIFESICQHKILAERYEQKARNILQYQKESKKPKKFMDEALRNSPTLLQ